MLCCGLYGYGEQDEQKNPDLLPYWGHKNNNLVTYFKSKGYEVYYPSLGPYNGAWDRACILWAYLFGGRVDYGKVHSAKKGHARYGATYPGVLKDLGKSKAHAKIDLFGHSFGGATVKEISNLFTQGDKAERESGEHSPLFDGGHGDLLHTVTTLSGVNNGTTAATLANRFGASLVTISAVMLTEDNDAKSYDKMLDQWTGTKVSRTVKYSKNILDNIAAEMDVDMTQLVVNPNQVVNPGTYYFAMRAAKSPAEMSGSCKYCGYLMDVYPPTAGVKYNYDWLSWYRNDGFVNLAGQSAPFNQKFTDGFWNGTEFKPGIWYNMPEKSEDHLFWCGHSGYIHDLYSEFDKILKLYDRLK